MKKKKILYLIILIILIGLILTAYNAFNGNPISNILGKKIVVNYLNKNYPNEEFRVEKGFYNFKFNEYSYDVIKIGEDPYATLPPDASPIELEKFAQGLNYYVTVKGTFNPKVRYDAIRYARLDEKLSQRLSEEACSEIFSDLQKTLSNLKAIEANVEILKFSMNENISWSKDLKLDRPISLHIVTDATTQTADETLADGMKIQQLLKEFGYTYSNVTINGNAFDKDLGEKDEYGYVKYSFSFTPNTSLSVKDIDTFK